MSKAGSVTERVDSAIVNRRVPLARIVPHPRNYKHHPYSQLTRICTSLVRWGQVKSIVVQDGPDYLLAVAGHGVWLAANMIVSGEFLAPPERVEQLRELDCRVVPADWTPAQVEGYLVADNLIAQGGEDDGVLLSQLLIEQRDAGYELESLGTSGDELDLMLADLADAALDDADDDEHDEHENENEEADEDDDAPAPGGDIRIFADDAVAEQAFSHYRALGFPYRALPAYLCMQQVNALANTPDERLLKTINGYHVADTYHPHRFHGHAGGKKSPLEAFGEDKLLRRTLALYQEHDGKIPADILPTLSVVSGTQACSNFRPGFALYLYREFCHVDGATVLDTSTGYGGRLVGYLASGHWLKGGKYLGIDPNRETHDGNMRMLRDFGVVHAAELYDVPAEDLPPDVVRGRCDFAFTSPPYFSKEHYSEDDTQSWVRYGASGDAWRRGFLMPMLVLQWVALKRGSTSIINIADVTVNKKKYPLVAWTIEEAQLVGFEHVETREFRLQTRFGANMGEEEASEPVIVLRKPL